ncbi:MAG: aminopeptidase P N-terminal domain-containing protein [Bacillota bacterium]
MNTQASQVRCPYFQTDFEAGEFVTRRTRVMEGMGRKGMAVIGGAAESPGFDPFRQTNDFYYLCGVEVPHAYLLMDAEKGVSTLYLPGRDAKHEERDGPMLCAEDGEFAEARTGVDEVKLLPTLPADLQGHRCVYVPHGEGEGARMCQDTLRRRRQCMAADPMAGRTPGLELLTRVAEICPGASLHDLSPIVQRLRLIKSEPEIRVLRRAGKLAALAVTEAMRNTKAGMYEYQFGAVADYVFLNHGARGSGYRSIIATGENIWMMHYWRNNTRLRNGEWVLMDYAPDVNNYTSDIGRMWPVNGTYSAVQRELYGFVVEYHKVLLSLIRPGVWPEQILHEAAERMRPRMESWGFSKEIYREGARQLLASKRPLSHGVGMAVHEATGYFGRPLEVGTVFAVDPELVVPEEKLYIRCEDTVAVTEKGMENLTAPAPLELSDVEAAMKEPKGLGRYV